MLILATSSQTFHSYFPLFDVDHLKIANCSNLTIVFYQLGNFGQALCIRSYHEDLILTWKSHNCSGIAFIQEDSAGGSKLIKQTLPMFKKNKIWRVWPWISSKAFSNNIPTFRFFCFFVEQNLMDSSYILWNKFQDYQLRFILTNHFW